jgi:hypothetical protein
MVPERRVGRTPGCQPSAVTKLTFLSSQPADKREDAEKLEAIIVMKAGCRHFVYARGPR